MDAIPAPRCWLFSSGDAVNSAMQEPDDAAQWIRRMAAGDASAASELYAAYARRVYAYAFRITGEAALAEDVTQEALVAAWRSAKRFRGDGRGRTWLLGIAHHLALKAIRRRSEPISPAIAETFRSPAPSPEHSAQAGELAACVRQGLQRMSVEHRTALELVFFQGLNLQEAAEVCACPVGTIKSRLSYAKASLKAALARAGVAAEDVR